MTLHRSACVEVMYLTLSAGCPLQSVSKVVLAQAARKTAHVKMAPPADILTGSATVRMVTMEMSVNTVSEAFMGRWEDEVLA